MIDHDRLFKELLTSHIREFIELFMPDVASYLVKESLHLMDKELFTDIPGLSRQEADLVFKGKFQAEEAFFLLHLEHQATAPAEMAKRMLGYFFRLTEKYQLPVYPVVIYSHQPPKEGAEKYEIIFPDRKVLFFQYRPIVLKKMSWMDYLKNLNPVAAALMSLMGVEEKDQWKVKLECLRMVLQLKIDPQRMRFITLFIDNYLQLSGEQLLIFKRETDKLEQAEKEHFMELTTSWKEEGKVEGRTEGLRDGILIGRQEGQRKLCTTIERQLMRRCGSLSSVSLSRLRQMEMNSLEKLADALLDFDKPEDFESWLIKNS